MSNKPKPENNKQPKQPSKAPSKTPNAKNETLSQPVLPTQNASQSNNHKTPKHPSPPPEPMTQEQIQAEQQRKQALKRLTLMQEISHLTQDKKSTLLLDSIVQNIQNDIVSSNVSIPEEPQQITKYLQKKKDKEKTKQTKQLSQSELLDKQYKSLVQKKQIMIEQLRQMELDQNKIRKQKTDSSLSNSNLKFNKMPQLTEEAKQHWRKVRQMVKEHEENSKRMQELIQKKMHQDIALQQQLQQKKKKQLSLQKRKAIEHKIQQIKIRHYQRTNQVKESEVIVQRLQKKTKLFQKMQDNWTKYEQQIKCQDEIQQFESQHARRLIKIREIKKYENQHDEKFNQLQEKRKIKLSQSKLTAITHSFQKTRFSVDILQEAKRNKQIEDEKLHQIKQLIQRKKQYSTNIKQKFRSMSKLQKPNETTQESKKMTLNKQGRSMSALDIRNKGNQYMRTINSSVSSLKGRSQSKKQLKPLQPLRKQYKNYLPQVLTTIAKPSQGSSSANRDIDMIHTIMRKQNASTEQKFFQAQMITQKLQAGGKQKDILNSINAKIEILKRLAVGNN